MTALLLVRESTSAAGTVGRIFVGGELVCRSIELPWRENAPGLSCIPTGTYRVAYLPRSASGKYHDVYHVLDVPGRSGILIHPANFAGAKDRGLRSDLLGCIAPGRRIGMLPIPDGSQLAAIDSRGALRDLHAITNREAFTLTIKGDLPCWRPS